MTRPEPSCIAAHCQHMNHPGITLGNGSPHLHIPHLGSELVVFHHCDHRRHRSHLEPSCIFVRPQRKTRQDTFCKAQRVQIVHLDTVFAQTKMLIQPLQCRPIVFSCRTPCIRRSAHEYYSQRNQLDNCNSLQLLFGIWGSKMPLRGQCRVPDSAIVKAVNQVI